MIRRKSNHWSGDFNEASKCSFLNTCRLLLWKECYYFNINLVFDILLFRKDRRSVYLVLLPFVYTIERDDKSKWL